MRTMNKKISNNQITALIVCSMIGTGILSLPNDVAMKAGTDGWMGILIIGIGIIPIIVMINKIFEMFPDKTFFEIGRIIFGKIGFNIFLIGFLLHEVLVMSIVSRNFAEMITSFLLERTPKEIIIFAFILVCVYISRTDIHIIGRMCYHIYPVILLFTVFLVLISLPTLDITNMLPALQSDMKGIAESTKVSFSAFVGYQVLFFCLPFAEDRKNSLKSSIKGTLIASSIYLIIFVVSISQFGLNTLKKQTIPMFSLIKLVDSPVYFLENLDGLVVAIWVVVVFGTMIPVFYSSGKILADICKVKDHSIFILPLVPIIYIITLLPENILRLSDILGNITDILGFIILVIMTVVVYIIAKYKTRRSKA